MSSGIIKWRVTANAAVVFALTCAVLLCGFFQPVNSIGPKHNYRVVCYVGTWATYRPAGGKFDIHDIDPKLCTHLIYAFAGLSEQATIVTLDTYLDVDRGWMRQFINLKEKNPRLKTLVAIGGWNEGATKYSEMASDKARRATFVRSVVDFLSTHKFDGLDLDWEYPGQKIRGGKPEDKANFAMLVKELRLEFQQHGWLLTAAIGASRDVIDGGYEITSLSRDLDFINVMCYDYHGGWDKITGHNAPLYASPDETDTTVNINFTISHLISLGTPPKKLVLGMPLYARTFKLEDTQKTGPRSSVSGDGPVGPYTNQSSFMGYNEFCELMKGESWTVVRDPHQKVPYAYKGDAWVSYDDVESIKEKVNFARRMELGGGMLWSLETDDFQGRCGKGAFPLLAAVNDGFEAKIADSTSRGTSNYIFVILTSALSIIFCSAKVSRL